MESPLEHFFREGFINDTSFEPLKIVKLETVPVKGERVKINSKQNKKTRKKAETENTGKEELSRVCPDCGKILSSQASLYVHLKSHSSNKPYICTECGANFTRKYYLEVHQRSHTGERPFKCDICDKYFSQKSSLNTHKRKHTGEKPFKCKDCQKTFSAQSYLVSHQWTHYKKVDGVFICPDCNLSFENRGNFSQHIRSHYASLDYGCSVCFKKFSKESYLIRHLNGSHCGDL